MDSHIMALLWLLPTAIASFGVKFLRDLSISVQELNRHMAVTNVRIEANERRLSDHEGRLRMMEAHDGRSVS